jgi:hypothetical protein
MTDSSAAQSVSSKRGPAGSIRVTGNTVSKLFDSDFTVVLKLFFCKETCKTSFVYQQETIMDSYIYL